MGTKPGDFFIGIIDFFAILLPGSILLAYILTSYPCIIEPISCLQSSSMTVKWITFLIAAYFLGHFLFAAGSLLFDWTYDEIYKPAKCYTKNKKPPYKKYRLIRFSIGLKYAFSSVFDEVKKEEYFRDSLCDKAKGYIDSNLRGVEGPANCLENTGEPTNTYGFCESFIRLMNTAAIAEIEKIQAQSKLFRSLSLLLLILILGLIVTWICPTMLVSFLCPSNADPGRTGIFFGRDPQNTSVLVFLILNFLLSIWRFNKLRWNATRRVYEYFIAIQEFAKSDSKLQPGKMS